jgi:hypothetical protein
LVVTVLQVTDSAKIVPQQDIIFVPIYVIVNNQGQATADIFKLSAHYAGLGGKFVAPFSVSGQSNNWYPYSTAPLAVGHEVTFSGIVTLPAGLQGQTVVLSVLADSCSGDESMLTYCRVAESNESNNESPLLALLLPSNYPPSVTISVPDADKTYIYGDKILLSGSAIDREDGVLGGSSLVWSNEGTTLGPGAEVDVTSYLNDGCGVWYPFTLTATDRDGNATTATRKIYIDCSLN